MKKKFLLPLVLLIFASLACRLPFVRVVRGSGNIISETREISDFSKIVFNGMGQVVLSQGETESLQIEAEDNIMALIKSDVNGDTLTLGFDEDTWRRSVMPTEPVKYTLTVKDLSKITINGAFHITASTLEVDNLDMTINGAGNFEFENLTTGDFVLQLNGSANVEISGTAETQAITFDGAGNYDGSDFKTSDATVSYNGLGQATVWATETLDITINGGGNLNYYGNPSITQDINGAGEISNLGEK